MSIPPLGSLVEMWHASIGGYSGIVARGEDDALYFFDRENRVKYLVHECPPVTQRVPVARDIVPLVLAMMRQARLVHRR